MNSFRLLTMNKKIPVLFIVYLFCLTLYSNENKKTSNTEEFNSMLLKYRNNFQNENRILIGGTFAISNKYLVDCEIFHYQWIKKDSFNNNKYNASLFSIIDIGMLLIKDKIFPKIDSTNFLILSPILITNSTHNFIILGKVNFSPINPDKTMSTALFLKNNTNFYCFRQNKWFETSPGAGLKLYYGFFAIDIGYEKKIQYELFKKTKSYDSVFFTVNWYINALV